MKTLVLSLSLVSALAWAKDAEEALPPQAFTPHLNSSQNCCEGHLDSDGYASKSPAERLKLVDRYSRGEGNVKGQDGKAGQGVKEDQ